MPPPTRANSATAEAPVAKPSTMPMFVCMRPASSALMSTPTAMPNTMAMSHSDRPSSANDATHRPMVRPDLKLMLSALATDSSAAWAVRVLARVATCMPT